MQQACNHGRRERASNLLHDFTRGDMVESRRRGLETDFVGNREGDLVRVSFRDRVTAPPEVMVRLLDSEAVLLNLETEKYFGLDRTGTRMWQLVTAAPAIDAAFEQLLEEYDVAPEMLRANLAELLGKLVEYGLLHVVPCDVETPATI
jgi:hypothetical protein